MQYLLFINSSINYEELKDISQPEQNSTLFKKSPHFNGGIAFPTENLTLDTIDVLKLLLLLLSISFIN